MANNPEITKENELIEPLNPTDPIVFLDPVNNPNSIPKIYMPSSSGTNGDAEGETEENNMGLKGTTTRDDSTKVDGVFIPIIKLNNHVIDNNKIISMKITYKEFYPKISLIVNDFDSNIQSGDIPGMNNEIVVILTPGKPGVYKNIKIPFYIRKCSNYGDNMIMYAGEYKNILLEKNILKQIKFSGCSSEFANNQANNKPNTWELLYQIALECGLGFASTEDCNKINDNRYRLIQSEKYSDVILDRISYGGLSDKELFDAWIDVYGYLVLVNLPYIFDSDVKPQQLSIIAETGIKGTENTSDIQEHLPVQRLITNQQFQNGGSNLIFKESMDIVNTKEIKNKGTLNTNYFVIPRGNGGNNSISIEDLQIIEDSIDGITGSNEYEFGNNNFLGFEQQDIPYLQQKQIHEAYINKRMFKQFKIKLETPNYGLERGTLVNISTLEYDPNIKQKLIQQQSSSMIGDVDSPSEYDNFNEEWKKNSTGDIYDELLQDNSKGVVNISKSGLYYIAGMDFEYISEEQKINQYLYLIKKDFSTNIDNKYTRPKINVDM